jgi:hypothetical protein
MNDNRNSRQTILPQISEKEEQNTVNKSVENKKECQNTVLEVVKTICARSGNNIGEVDCGLYNKLIYGSHNDLCCELRKQYSQLLVVKWEFEVTFLACVGFDNFEIASLLRLKKNTVEHIKGDIRKRFSIEKGGDIKSFFLDNMKEKQR